MLKRAQAKLKFNMKSEDYISLEEKYGAHNYHPLDVVIMPVEGVWVYDSEGRKHCCNYNVKAYVTIDWILP